MFLEWVKFGGGLILTGLLACLFVIGPLLSVFAVKRKVAWLITCAGLWLLLALPFISPEPGSQLCFPAAIFYWVSMFSFMRAYGDAEYYAPEADAAKAMFVIDVKGFFHGDASDTTETVFRKVTSTIGNIESKQDVCLLIAATTLDTSLWGVIFEVWQHVNDGGGKLTIYHTCETEQILSCFSIIGGLPDLLIGGRLKDATAAAVMDSAGPARTVSCSFPY